jgi:hypothetical protein
VETDERLLVSRRVVVHDILLIRLSEHP